MVEPVGNNHNIKLKGTNVQLNSNNLKGTVLTKKDPIFLRKYDKDGDGVISQKEANIALRDLKKVAGNDVLSAKEFEKAKLGKKADLQKIAEIVNNKKPGKVSVTHDGDATISTTRNEDGSVTKVVTQGNLRITSNYDVNGNLTYEKAVNPKGSRETQFKYDENGNLLNKNTINKDSKNKLTGSAKSTYTYDESGNRIGENRVEYDSKGNTTRQNAITIQNNENGQPVKVLQKTTDAKGKVIFSSVQENQYQEGKLVSSATKNTNKDSVVLTQKKYAADGKTVLGLTQNIKNNDGTSSIIEQKHNKYGKVTEKHTIKKEPNGNVTTDIILKAEYKEDGKTIKSQTTKGIRNSKPYEENSKFDSNGKLSSVYISQYKRGEKIEEYYEGVNLDNRYGYIPSKQVVYEDDGKTVKNITVNQFDKNGVLIGSEIQDKAGNVIATHDFSKVDGKFDIAYQKNRGDCYMLAGLNALSNSEGGRQALKDTVTIGKDPKTGETTYTVKFPGAAKIRENLIKQGVPEDQIDIKDSYTYTESEIYEKAKLAGKKYSAGDKDILLMEVSYEDLRNDAKADIDDLKKVNPKLSDNEVKKSLHIQGMHGMNDDDTLSGGQGYDFIYMVTGEACEVYSPQLGRQNNNANPICSIGSDLDMQVTGEGYKLTEAENAKVESMFDKIEKDCADGKADSFVGTVGLKISTQTVNGKLVNAGGHEFTISKVEGDKVYLLNPWDPTKEIVMTRDEIKKAAHSVSLKEFDSEGKPVENTNEVVTPGEETHDGGKISETPQAGNGYKVPQGKGYKTLLAEALKEQGIEPTAENIKKASEQFKAANKGAVHVYNGSNSKYRGNEYLIKGEVVKIPKFEM